MSKLRTGPIYTKAVLENLLQATQTELATLGEEDQVFSVKIHGLQKFLHHGMSCFSIEAFQQVLQTLLVSCTTDKDEPVDIRSLADLRTSIKMMMMVKRDSGSLKANDAKALMYTENFFFAIFCMTEAKRIFEDLYGDLYFSYFNPARMSRQATRIGSSKSGSFDVKATVSGEGCYQFGISTLEQMSGTAEHKLRQTVQDLKEVLTRWSSLLTEEAPQLSSFELESEQDLLQLRSSPHVQPVLRLLPDMFAKFYKSLELLKQWWSLAHETCPQLHFQRSSVADISSALSAGKSDKLAERMGRRREDENTANAKNNDFQVKSIIENSKEVLKSLHEELQTLEEREEHFQILNETYKKVAQEIELQKAEKLQLLAQRERINAKGDREEIEMVEDKLYHHEDHLKLLEFQHALLAQDYAIQLEIRPSIIRFQGQVAARIKDIQLRLDKQSIDSEILEQETWGGVAFENKTSHNRQTSWGKIDSKTSPELVDNATKVAEFISELDPCQSNRSPTNKMAKKKQLLVNSGNKRSMTQETGIDKNYMNKTSPGDEYPTLNGNSSQANQIIRDRNAPLLLRRKMSLPVDTHASLRLGRRTSLPSEIVTSLTGSRKSSVLFLPIGRRVSLSPIRKTEDRNTFLPLDRKTSLTSSRNFEYKESNSKTLIPGNQIRQSSITQTSSSGNKNFQEDGKNREQTRKIGINSGSAMTPSMKLPDSHSSSRQVVSRVEPIRRQSKQVENKTRNASEKSKLKTDSVPGSEDSEELFPKLPTIPKSRDRVVRKGGTTIHSSRTINKP